MPSLEQQFDAKMYGLYRQAYEKTGYPASRFHQSLTERGGVETVRSLLNAPTASDGFTAMWERGRLDLTVEAFLFHNPQFHELFTEDEIQNARDRLAEYHYPPAMR